MEDKLKFIFTSQASHELSNGKKITTTQLEEMIVPKSEDKPNKVVCRHQDYCNVRLLGNTNCLAEQQRCETFKFYNKYGESWNNLGVGA